MLRTPTSFIALLTKLPPGVAGAPPILKEEQKITIHPPYHWREEGEGRVEKRRPVEKREEKRLVEYIAITHNVT